MFARRIATVALLLAAGCGKVNRYDTSGWVVDETSTEDAATDPDEGPAEGSFELTAVWPAFGSDRGGSEIRVVGGPFDRFAEVLVGGEPATIVSATAEELVVEAPPGAPGFTDLEVVSDGLVRTHPFRYWPDATGLVGMKGSIEYVDVVGTYWTDGGYDRARAEIQLVEPVRFESWEAFSPAFNSCASDWALPSDTPIDGMDDVTLVSADIRVDLEADDDGFFGEGGVAPGESYDLEPSGDWDGVVLDDLVEVPLGLQVLSPQLDGSMPKKVDRQFELTWDRQLPADYVAIVMEKAHMNPNGSLTIDQKISCAVPDAGSFTVPGSVWSDWQADDVVTVSIGRVFEGNGVVLPHNNSESAVTGIYWVAGALRTK